MATKKVAKKATKVVKKATKKVAKKVEKFSLEWYAKKEEARQKLDAK